MSEGGYGIGIGLSLGCENVRLLSSDEQSNFTNSDPSYFRSLNTQGSTCCYNFCSLHNFIQLNSPEDHERLTVPKVGKVDSMGKDTLTRGGLVREIVG